jgi:hypothetical protein
MTENLKLVEKKSDPFIGTFVYCGKLTNGDWTACMVNLREIKSIEDDKEQRYTKAGCIFYTYKDIWYAVDVNLIVLAEKINEILIPFNPTKYLFDKLQKDDPNFHLKMPF